MPKTKIVKLIYTEERRGTGTRHDPVRLCPQLWSLDGKLVAEEELEKGKVVVEFHPENINRLFDKEVKITKKTLEKPNPDGPLGWIKTLHERGELTIHPNSGIAHRIEQVFGVKLNKGIFN